MTRFRSTFSPSGTSPGSPSGSSDDLVAHPDPAPLDPADGDPADEAGEVEGGDQHLERTLGIALGLGDVIENGLEQRGEIGTRLAPGPSVAVPNRLDV